MGNYHNVVESALGASGNDGSHPGACPEMGSSVGAHRCKRCCTVNRVRARDLASFSGASTRCGHVEARGACLAAHMWETRTTRRLAHSSLRSPGNDEPDLRACPEMGSSVGVKKRGGEKRPPSAPPGPHRQNTTLDLPEVKRSHVRYLGKMYSQPDSNQGPYEVLRCQHAMRSRGGARRLERALGRGTAIYAAKREGEGKAKVLSAVSLKISGQVNKTKYMYRPWCSTNRNTASCYLWHRRRSVIVYCARRPS